ncbi:MAG: DUF5320 domain-containing protein [Dehalococcoidales bacterium]|nr:DUF5320 domain-containing protein [Dehalococcoidales bacterium]
MPGFDRTGPNGLGPMTGGARGFCNPWRGRTHNYALPRWGLFPRPRFWRYGFSAYVPQMSRDQELEYLKSQAEILKNELENIETEISKLSVEKE